MQWDSFHCPKPIQIWLLVHQLISLCLVLGYELAHCLSGPRTGTTALLPVSGSRRQRVVSFSVLFLIVPAFLASDFLGLFWIMGYTSDTNIKCWPKDIVNQPQVIRLALVVGSFIGMFFVLFSLSFVCTRLRHGRARPVAAGADAGRGSAAAGARLIVPVQISIHCPEGECDEACNVKCCICMEDCLEGQQMRTVVVCGHQYHSDCLEKWLRNRPTCPLCNQDVTTSVV